MFINPELLMKARIALQAKEANDPRYNELIKQLSERLSIPSDQVEHNIALLATGHNI